MKTCAVTWCRAKAMGESAFPFCTAHNVLWHCSYECERADPLRMESMLADFVRRVSLETAASAVTRSRG